MSSRTSQWRNLNKQLLCCLDEDSDEMHAHCSEVVMGVNQNSPMSEDDLSNIVQNLTSLSSNALSGESSLEDFDGHPLLLEQTTESDTTTISSESEDDFTENESMLPELATWAMRQNLSHLAISGLMKILRKHVSKDLPADARTVLKTPRVVPVANLCSGESSTLE